MDHYEWPTDFWPHQTRGCEQTVQAIESGQRRIILTSPTGMGKSRIMVSLIEWASDRQWRSVLYTHRRLLFDQTSGVLNAHGIEHGLRAAGHDPALLRRVQLCMTQSEFAAVFRRKRRELHPALMVLSDEIHAQNGTMLPTIHDAHYADGAALCAVTATPIDLSGTWDKLVVAGTTSEGRRCGALVPAYTYCPDEPDLKHIKNYRVGEDLTDKENRKVMMRPGVFGRVFEHWKRLNPTRRPTILFAPDVAGSIYFAEQFHKEGVRAAHIDAKQIWFNGEYLPSDDENRHRILEMTETGQVEVLTNRFCLDSETEILTRRGWASTSDLTPTDSVANWDNGCIFFLPPRKIIRRPRMPGERMVVLETPRRSVRVTENHDLLYRTAVGGMFSKAMAGSLVGARMHIPVSGTAEPEAVSIPQQDMLQNLAKRITANAFLIRQRGGDPKTSREVAEQRIRARASLRYTQPHELSLRECEFIGFMIGDGGTSHLQSGGVEYRIYQTTAHPKIIEWIDRLIEAIGVDCVRHQHPTPNQLEVIQWSFSRGTGFGSQRRLGLYHLEPYLNKDGTDLFWGLNQEQFDALLRGLWLANGLTHRDTPRLPPSNLRICCKHRRLFDLLQAIATCRGYRASVRRYSQTNPKHGSIFHLSLTKAETHTLTKYPLVFEDGWKDEEVWCVESDSGNIITRRRGSVTVLGNCLREGINLPHIGCCIFACVAGSLRSYLQMGGRALRAHPSMDHVVIIDHGGNYRRHGSLNADRDWFLGQSGYKTTGLREEAMRERPELEPIICPKCGMARLSGPTCPKCGHTCHKRSRVVVQVNGALKLVEGPAYRPHRTAMKADTEAVWKRYFYGAKRKNRTFNQAAGWMEYNEHYRPPKDLPLMPIEPGDWYERIGDVPRERLR
jgi:superfamily II DNA or RNA helicase